MKLLMITPYFPYPTNHGGKVRIFNIIKNLALKGYRITLVSFASDEKVETSSVNYMKKYCEKMEMLYWVKVPSSRLKRFFMKVPEFYYSYIQDKAAAKIAKIIGHGDFDIIQIEYTYGGLCLKKKYPVLTALTMHEVESNTTKRKIKYIRLFLKKIYAHFQNYKIRRSEIKMIKYSDISFACSLYDKELIEKLVPDREVFVVPNGVDVEFNKPLPVKSDNKHSIIFTGAMNTIPNTDAVSYFSNRILPMIRKNLPDLWFKIVGSNPWNIVKELAMKDPRTILISDVKDIREYILGSTVFVAPLRIAGGTRLKILEAMALGRPVVSTSAGCEGLEVTDWENILIADGVDEFAGKIIKLLKDPLLRNRITKNARKLVEERYCWKKIVSRLDEIYKEKLKV